MSLASYRQSCERMIATWPEFTGRRQGHLDRQWRPGIDPVTAHVLEDLFTMVLDWRFSEISALPGGDGMVLARQGIRHLTVLFTRPGTLAWDEHAAQLALLYAHRLARQQGTRSVAISDAILLSVCDLAKGGCRHRMRVSLDQPQPPVELWWLSTDGIWRPRDDPARAQPHPLSLLVAAEPGDGPVSSPCPPAPR